MREHPRLHKKVESSVKVLQKDGFVATELDGQLTPIYHPHGWSLVL